MVIPNWLQSYFNTDDLQRVEQKIASIESRADVEIVPVIVRVSSAYPQTRITISLLFFILFLEASWSAGILEKGPMMQLMFVGALLVSVLAIAPLLARWGKVQMLLTHRFVEEEQCWKRAELEFHTGRVSRTLKDNGLLIFISLLEHRVIVKADKGISDKLDPSVWQEAVSVIIKHKKKRQMGQGIHEALVLMENLLIEHFPMNSEKPNEIPNTIIIKE